MRRKGKIDEEISDKNETRSLEKRSHTHTHMREETEKEKEKEKLIYIYITKKIGNKFLSVLKGKKSN